MVAHTVTNDDLNDRLINAESMLDREIGKEALFPKLANVVSQEHLGANQVGSGMGHNLLNVMSQDNLLDAKKNLINVPSTSILRAEMSTVTDNRQTAVDTHPQSKSGPTADEEMRGQDASTYMQDLTVAE